MLLLQVYKVHLTCGISKKTSWWRTCQQKQGKPMETTTSWGWRPTLCICLSTVMPTSPLCWMLSCMLCWPRDHMVCTPLAKGLTCPSASFAAFLSGSMTFSLIRCWVLSLSQGRWEHQKKKARISKISISVCLTWWHNWGKLYFKTAIYCTVFVKLHLHLLTNRSKSLC